MSSSQPCKDLGAECSRQQVPKCGDPDARTGAEEQSVWGRRRGREGQEPDGTGPMGHGAILVGGGLTRGLEAGRDVTLSDSGSWWVHVGLGLQSEQEEKAAAGIQVQNKRSSISPGEEVDGGRACFGGRTNRKRK